MKTLFYFVIISISMLGLKLNAQNCGTCTSSVNNSDTSIVVVNAGQTFCVDTMGVFNGRITVNGGSICVKGMFNPQSFNFYSGVITNSGNMTLNVSALVLNSGSSLTNNQDAILNLNGTLTIAGGSFANNGILNIDVTLNANSGALTNTGIINCTTVNGISNIANTGNVNSN